MRPGPCVALSPQPFGEGGRTGASEMIVANWGKYFGYCRHMLFRVQYIQFPRDSPGLFVVIYGMRPRLACRRIDDVRFILNANVRFDGSRCDTLCSQHHSGNSPDSTFLLLLIMEKVLLSLWRMPFRQLIACPSLLGLDSRWLPTYCMWRTFFFFQVILLPVVRHHPPPFQHYLKPPSRQ
jgi:hypothetical protein